MAYLGLMPSHCLKRRAFFLEYPKNTPDELHARLWHTLKVYPGVGSQRDSLLQVLLFRVPEPFPPTTRDE